MSSLQTMMQGKWREALIRLGMDPKILDGNGHPCPLCQSGTDRFCFSDKNGHGLWFCRGCGGGGDGVKLALRFTGMHFVELAKTLEEMVGALPTSNYQMDDAEKKLRLAAKIWKESKPGGRIVEAYLRSRGYTGPIPHGLREHPSLEYKEKQGDHWVTVGLFPAMIAQILDPNGKKAVGIHRTYLDPAGGKAHVPQPKKSLGTIPEGSAIRLHRPRAENGVVAALGAGEGIETSLAGSQFFGVPVWATVDAGGMEGLQIPGSIRRILIFADHDPSRTGLKAASTLAYRLIRAKHDVTILMPTTSASDWADILTGKVPCEYFTL